MIVTAAVVTGTAPVALVTVDTDGRYGQSIAVRNVTAETVYLGPADVTAATGWPLVDGAELSADLDPGEVLYAMSAAAGQVRTLRVGA